MVFFRKGSKPKLSNRLSESGNVFMMLIGAVGMVGVIGASTMTVMKGPVKTMSEVTKRTIAENNMIAAGKLALIAATAQADTDCDDDLYLEPIPYGAPVAGFSSNGGELPATIGVAKEDPWGHEYVYCAWDHGPEVDADACTGQNRNVGVNGSTEYAVAIISAGPDGVYNTTCNDYSGPGTIINKASGSDDLVLGYTYAEAGTLAGGVWNLNASDSDIAEIQKDLSVKGSDDVERFAFNADSGDLTLGGAGTFPSIRTDNLQAYLATNINVLSPLESSAGSLTIADDLAVTGNTTTTGNTTLGDAVTDTTTIAGPTTVGSTLGVTGAATVGGTLGVTGDITLSSSTIRVPVGDTLDVLEGAAGVSGALRAGGIHIGGNYTTIPVDGEVTTTAPTNIVLKPGGTTAMTLDSTTQNVAVSNNLNVSGTTNVQTLNVGGQLTLNNDITVNPDIQFGSQGLIASDSTMYFNIDSDNNQTTSAFTFAKDSPIYTGSTEIFRINENGSLKAYGQLDMTNNKIINLGTPTIGTDATTKAYVDGAIGDVTGIYETDPYITKPMGMNKWCYSDGSKIICNKNDPTVAGDGDNLGNGGTTTGTLFSTNATATLGRDATDLIRFDDNAQAFWKINGNWEYQFYPTNFSSYTNNDKDLGTSAKKWKNGYFAGDVSTNTISGTTKISFSGVAGSAPTK